MNIILNKKYLKLHGAKAYAGENQSMIGLSNNTYWYKMQHNRYWSKASRKLDDYIAQFRTIEVTLESILGEYDEINS